ncbi:MAG TPA: GFA family protein [Rhizomicrobium sp.]|jgi:hypothetical protein
MRRKASCCCGACAIEVEGEPALNALCHCSSCKRRTGSAFGWSAYFPDDRIVAKSGDLRVYAKGGDNPFQRSFCAKCGTTLFWKSQNFLPDQTGIAGGCFTGDPLPSPNLSANETGRCAWVSLPDEWLHAP